MALDSQLDVFERIGRVIAIAGDAIHIVLPHGSDGARGVLVQIDVRNGLEKSELVAKIRHAVVFEHQPGTQLVLGLFDLLPGYPFFR